MQVEKAVTVVKFRVNNEIGDGTGCFEIKVMFAVLFMVQLSSGVDACKI